MDVLWKDNLKKFKKFKKENLRNFILPLRWHVIWDTFLHYFDSESKNWWHHNMFHIFYLVHTKGRDRNRKKSTKSSTRTHAYRPYDYAIHWGDLYLLDIPGNVCTWTRLGTPHRQKSHSFDGLGITSYIESYEMLCEWFCYTCFMGHFGRRIRSKHLLFTCDSTWGQG